MDEESAGGEVVEEGEVVGGVFLGRDRWYWGGQFGIEGVE